MPTVSTKVLPSIYPEIVPGGLITGDDLISGADSRLQNLCNYVNSIANTVNLNFNTIGNALGFAPRYIGGRGTTANPGIITTGNRVLRRGAHGQYVAAWSTETNGAYLMMSKPPYTTWTDLSGNQPGPTRISAGSTSGTKCYPCIAINPSSGTLLVNILDTTTTRKVYSFEEQSDYTYLLNSTETTTFTPGSLSTGNGDDYILYEPTTVQYYATAPTNYDIDAVWRWNGTTGWQLVANFNGLYDSGTVHFSNGSFLYGTGIGRRLVVLPAGGYGAGYLLYLSEFGGGSGANIGWSLSDLNSNPLFPGSYGTAGGAAYRAFGGANVAGGTVFPLNGIGSWVTSNLAPTAFSGSGGIYSVLGWNVAGLPGVSRAGLVYLGLAINGQQAGVYYTEFDPTANVGLGAWTPQANHVRLWSFVGEMQPVILASATTIRVFWIHSQQWNNVSAYSNNSYAIYMRSCPIDQGTNPNAWTAARQVALLPVSGSSSGNVYTSQMCCLFSGEDTVNGAAYVPLMYSEQDAQNTSLLKMFVAMLSVAALDLP